MVGVKSGTWVCPLICLLYLLAFLQVEGDNVPMTLLKCSSRRSSFQMNSSSYFPVCLDGSPPAYHLSPGSGSGANNWLVFVEGGGWCSTVEYCVERKSNFRGSSKHMPPLSFSGMLGGVQKSNPDFYNWNRVKIRYCDGASFTGDIETVDPATDLHFRGARVWRAIMKDLLAKGMNKAENALLGGCSAGGLTTILHCDSFRSLLPASAKVKCFSDAGYFIDAKDISGADSIQSFYGDVVKLHASANNLPSSCTSRLPASKNVVATMQTPLFILNAAYDQWQIRNILVPTSADRNNTWETASSTSRNVLRINFRHCKDNVPERTAGGRQLVYGIVHPLMPRSLPIRRCGYVPIGKAVGDWYFDRSSAVRKIDCPYPCNTSCRRVATDSMED
ncbi:pectinacetylesterase domain containing protein [Musa troglodytarum]|uniref:Pectin acetylesterase n=1 Tax=Musa troglodytarum TaxID=320322 RepID=A0A9E7GN56_9LILI|nr:pectinacetylesterase domain containing protein [Musa troglodytarum]